jgi:Flp pilus assembly protein TadB
MTGVPDAAELTRRSADLSRSFSLSAVVFLINLVAPLMLTASAIRPVMAVLVVALLAAYVWYAIAAGRAARTHRFLAQFWTPSVSFRCF